jgi:hypothetical protein
MKKAKQSLVHRYTEFEYVIDYLKTGKLGFPSPGEWDDKNDIHFLRLYMEYRQVKNLFCCCFTSASETFHHWRIFAGKSIGVRLSFRAETLASELVREGVVLRPVEYVPKKDLKKRNHRPDDLAFIKRHGFRDEKEVRAMLATTASAQADERVRGIRVDLSSLSRITISPFCPENTYSVLRDRLREFKIGGVEIRKSRLVDSREWKKFGENILQEHG